MQQHRHARPSMLLPAASLGRTALMTLDRQTMHRVYHTLCHSHHPAPPHRTKLHSTMELAEVKAAAELQLQAKLLEAAQAELGRREAATAEREAAVMAAEQAARAAAAAASEREAAGHAVGAEAERAAAAQRAQLQQLQEQLRTEQGTLAAQRAQLEAWQAQLTAQQGTLEQLEATAAEAVAEARDAAAAALEEREQARCGANVMLQGCVCGAWG